METQATATTPILAPTTESPLPGTTLLSPTIGGMTEDHLRVLLEGTHGTDPLLADAAVTATSYRRGEVGEEAWWAARRRCHDAWLHLAAGRPAAEILGEIRRAVVCRLERELAHLRARVVLIPQGDGVVTTELRAWVAVDRVSRESRVARSPEQTAEGEDLYPIVALGTFQYLDLRAAVEAVVDAWIPSR